MTALEVYDLTTKGGGRDFAFVIEACESAGDYCLIGGLAVNCYVEPVYTLDADLVAVGGCESELARVLEKRGFSVKFHPHTLNAQAPQSDLRIQFTLDPRYGGFPSRAEERDVLGIRTKVACLEDVTQGKLWAYGDAKRRLSKRKKDELDLIRLAEAYPALKAHYPAELVAILGGGTG